MTAAHIQGHLLDSGNWDLRRSRHPFDPGEPGPVFFKLPKKWQSEALWTTDDEAYAIGVYRYTEQRGRRQGYRMVHWLTVENQVQQTLRCFFEDRQCSCNVFGNSWLQRSIAASTYRASRTVLHRV